MSQDSLQALRLAASPTAPAGIPAANGKSALANADPIAC